MLGLVSYDSSSDDEVEVPEVKPSSKVSASRLECRWKYIIDFVERR